MQPTGTGLTGWQETNTSPRLTELFCPKNNQHPCIKMKFFPPNNKANLMDDCSHSNFSGNWLLYLICSKKIHQLIQGSLHWMALGSPSCCTILTFKACSGNLHLADPYLRLEEDRWLWYWWAKKNREFLASIPLLAGKRMGAIFLAFFLRLLVGWLF